MQDQITTTAQAADRAGDDVVEQWTAVPWGSLNRLIPAEYQWPTP